MASVVLNEGYALSTVPTVTGGRLLVFLNREIITDLPQDAGVLIIDAATGEDMTRMLSGIPDDAVIGWQLVGEDGKWLWILPVALVGFLLVRRPKWRGNR